MRRATVVALCAVVLFWNVVECSTVSVDLQREAFPDALTGGLSLVPDKFGADPAKCESCKGIVGALSNLADNATEIKIVTELLHGVCHLKYNGSDAQLCDEITSGILNILPWAKTQLEKLAWNIPEAICSVAFPYCAIRCCDENRSLRPEQIHISLTGDPSQMAVTWVNGKQLPEARVWWGLSPSELTETAVGIQHTNNIGQWVGNINNAVMSGLKPDTIYFYRVGTDEWPSRTYWFRSMPVEESRPLRLLVIGDMGWGDASNSTIEHLAARIHGPGAKLDPSAPFANSTGIDVLLHTGDVSYADGYQRGWDIFWNKVSNVAPYVPYMTIPGNHECTWWNCSAYKSRVLNPPPEACSVSGAELKCGVTDLHTPFSSDQNLYYAFSIPYVHFVSLSTETFIDTADINEVEQAFVKRDLQAVNAVRKQYPWVVASGHRPLYCTNNQKGNCFVFADILRTEVEDLYNQGHVDVVFAGHQHDVERSFPLYKSKKVSDNYNSPTAPVYVLNGAAGNREGPPGSWITPAPEYVAFREKGAFGYGIVTVNRTAFHWEFWENEASFQDGPKVDDRKFVDPYGVLVDSFTITK